MAWFASLACMVFFVMASSIREMNNEVNNKAATFELFILTTRHPERSRGIRRNYLSAHITGFLDCAPLRSE